MQTSSSKPAPVRHLSSKMAPCIVDLSLESEDDCYIYPSKRHPVPQSSPSKHKSTANRTPKFIRTPKPTRTPSFPSSSSSIISFLSPPRKLQVVQTHITSFLKSPTKLIKLERSTTIEKPTKRTDHPRSFRMPSPLPVAPSIYFEKWELFVDDDEAPMPAAFSAPVDGSEWESPMDIDSLPDPIVLSSSPPAFHRGFAGPRPKAAVGPAKKRGLLKRNAGGLNAGGPKMPASVDVSLRAGVANVGIDTMVSTPPAQQVASKVDSGVSSNDFKINSNDFKINSNDLKVSSSDLKSGGQPDRPSCRAHTDPACNAVECVYDFFDEYSPFHDTLPEGNVGSKLQRQEMAKPLALAVPPVANVVNIRALKKQHIALLLASDTLDPAIRRPYMPLTSRQFLREVRTQPGVWEELFAGSDGCLIHVGFTPKECNILGSCIHTYLQSNPTPTTDFPALCESGEPSEDLHYYLKAAFTGINPVGIFERDVEYPMDRLPGRVKKDCVDFLIDATYAIPDPRDPFLRVDLLAGGKPKLPSRGVRRMLEELGPRVHLPMEASRVRAAYAMSLFQPVWRFENGASDILDIQWSPDGARFGMASAAYSDGYNRAGNLMLGASDPWKVKMLFRHAFRVRHQAVGNLDKLKWATVSSVRFSNTGSYYYSGSYDGSVKIWNGKSGQWISNIPLNAEVVIMATSPLQDHLIAAATKNGSVHIIRLQDGEPEEVNELHIHKEDEENQGLYASCLLFGNKRQPSWLIAGYDTSNDGQVHGGLAIFDVEVGKTVFGVSKAGKRTYTTRHFDIAMHEEGTMLVTASFQRPHKVHSPGIHSGLRVFDIRQMSSPVNVLKSPQKDINRVTISPCQDYITSSGTGGSTIVWDLRNTGVFLKELKHNESKLPHGPDTNLEVEDTGVTFAQWGPYHDRFYTGSSDGIVKEWDISAANPFLRDIAKVDTQIMSAAFSPSWDELIVGECSGTATLFSTRGDEGVVPATVDVDWTEDLTMMSPEEDMPVAVDVVGSDTVDVPEVEDSGVRLARQLVAEGKVWIRQGYAWAVDDTDIFDDEDYDYDEMVI